MSSVSPSPATIAGLLLPGIPYQPQGTSHFLGVQISKDQCNKLRLILIIDLVGRLIMKNIFSLGAPQKCMLQTLKGYLITVKGMSNGEYRKQFNRTCRDIIDGDLSCSSFDVSLWYAAIQCGCDGVAPLGDSTWHSSPDTLENHLKRIKDFRNDTFHGDVSISEQEFKDKCEELRNHFISTLDKAKDKYSIDSVEVNQQKNDVNLSIDYLRDTPFAQMDLSVDGNISTVLHEFVVEDLHNHFQKMSCINPAQVIVGSNIFLKVKNIFSELRICSAGRHDKVGEVIDHNDLLKHANEKRKTESGISHIFLIEGDAGAGKSTLLKLFLLDWTSDNTLMKELSNFKCIVNVQCRSRTYDSFIDLISDQMPTVRSCFREGIHMKKWVLDQPCLILVDGLDEMNSNSQKLYDEILEISHKSNVLILCTSRPQEIENCYVNPDKNINTTHVKIEGIPGSSREMFVRRYHDELIKEGFSTQSTDDLVRFMKSTEAQVMDFLKLPLNLTLLTVLWADGPAGIDALATVTELYSRFHDLSLNRLHQRLKQGKVTSFKGSEFKRNLRPFVKAMGFVALKGLREDVLILGENDLEHITDVCSSLHLPASELLDAFLIKENTWGATDINTYSCFYHKSNQEYYASRYIYMESEENPGKSIKKILEELQIIDLRKYQKILISVIGLHFYFENKDVESVVKELINLLQESGVNSLRKWINVLSMTKNNEKVAQEMCRVSPRILEEVFEITDGNLSAYMTLLKLHRPQKATIDIHGNPSEVPNIEECLDTLFRYKCKVKSLSLWYLFHHPADPGVGSSLNDKVIQVLTRCGVKYYVGSMSSLLPTLSRLRVSVRDGRMLQDLNHYLQSRRTKLSLLSISLPVDIDPTYLSPFSSECSSPRISDVTDNDIEKAAELFRMLQPIKGRKRFSGIRLPRATITSAGQMDLIQKLKTKGLKVNFISFPLSSKPSSDEERQEIIELGKKELGCSRVDWDPRFDI